VAAVSGPLGSGVEWGSPLPEVCRKLLRQHARVYGLQADVGLLRAPTPTQPVEGEQAPQDELARPRAKRAGGWADGQPARRLTLFPASTSRRRTSAGKGSRRNDKQRRSNQR
jgi:hypothetical protein